MPGIIAAQKVFLNPKRQAQLSFSLNPTTLIRELRATIWWKVLFKKPISDPLTVLFAGDGNNSHLPQPGEIYMSAAGGFAPELICTNVLPILDSEGRGLLWDVQVDYSTLAVQPIEADTWNVQISFDSEEVRETTYHDRDGFAITNTAGDPFENQPERVFYLPSINISFNTLRLNVPLLDASRGKVNANPVDLTINGVALHYPRNSLLLSKASASAVLTPVSANSPLQRNAQFWQCQFTLLYHPLNPEIAGLTLYPPSQTSIFGWTTILANVGDYAFDQDGNHSPYLTDVGLPGRFLFLDKNGSATQQPSFRHYNLIEEFDWTPLFAALKAKH